MITDWDAAEHLRDEADISAYLEAVFEDGDPRVIASALNDVARARASFTHGASEAEARRGGAQLHSAWLA
ncbi:MAG: hypothetical protein LBS82_05580 [Spirochaetaceae bacterium]|jgi:probable addiction module antidote protein|nr:hypothetical protein [Spirochaetaceae bacterium]